MCGCNSSSPADAGVQGSAPRPESAQARFAVYGADGSRQEAGSEIEAKMLITAAGGGSMVRI